MLELNTFLVLVQHVLFKHSLQMTFMMKVYIAAQILQALVFMHTSKPPLVHRDIKPANILVS